MLALLMETIQNLEGWEKVAALIVSSASAFFVTQKFLKFIFKKISETNKMISKFLDLIPKLENIANNFDVDSILMILNRLENNLYHTNQKLQAIISRMGLASFESDKSGLYTFVSKQWFEFTGLTSDEAIGNGWLNSIHENERNEVFGEWELCVKQSREFNVKTTLSNSKSVSIIAWPIRNLNGTVEKFFGILI